MTILFKCENETKTIEAICDDEFANTIMTQAKWLMDNMSDENIEITYQDIKAVVPTLSSAPDIREIQNIMREDKDKANRFVAICNSLAKSHIFSFTPCITFEI